MDEYDNLKHHAENKFRLTITLTIFATGLSLVVCLMSFIELAQSGPDVGEIVSFDSRNGLRYWSLPGIQALTVPNAGRPGATQSGTCILMPSVMSVYGGSLVIETKVTSRPPSFTVHWSGHHTELGAHDCGGAADLTLQLVQLRALANVAGGYGVNHLHRLF